MWWSLSIFLLPAAPISSPGPVLHGTKWLLWRPHILSPTLHSRCRINQGLIKRGNTIDLQRSRCKDWFLWSTYIHTYIPVTPTLEHRRSVKCFISLQFLNPNTVGRTPWMGDEPVTKPRPIQNKHRQTFMSWLGFEATIPACERAKAVHVLDREVTVIGCRNIGWRTAWQRVVAFYAPGMTSRVLNKIVYVMPL
jgi:hypothetical protein